METIQEQNVQITSVLFRQNGDQVCFMSYPRRLTYKGREYILADNQ